MDALKQLPAALAAMAAYPQFIICKLVSIIDAHGVPTGKTDKIPCDYRTGRSHVDAHDQQFHTTHTVAYAFVNANPGYCVAFSLRATDPFFCLDLDNCLQADNTWTPASQIILAALPGAAVEVSQSGRGLHVWGTYREIAEHVCKNSRESKLEFGDLELYHEGRFIALGQPNPVGNAATDCTGALPAVISRWFAPTLKVAQTNLTDGPCEGWRGPVNDEDLIRRMLGAKVSVASGFGGKATVSDLWTGNVEALARTYPSSTPGQPYDGNSADMALALHLSFWTGQDAARIERLMHRSALKRDKWNREDYLPTRTIPKAIAQTQRVCCDALPDLPVALEVAVESRHVTGDTIASPEVQRLMWNKFCYVVSDNMIMTDTGRMLNESSFNGKYMGLNYAMDTINEKFTAKPWVAFLGTFALRHPKPDCKAFRPDLPVHTIYTENQTSFVNSYFPPNIKRVPGDVSRLLRHIAKLLPDARDQQIVIAYMAALVQYRGHKFNWCIFLQGTHGNGKSLLSYCVMAAVGKEYSHMPRADALTEQFNGWLANTIFCGVEDIYLPHGREEILEILKPMITLDYQPIREMQRSQVMKHVCCNFILNSNHKDGIKKTREDRRFASLFCAQQEEEDLIRDGLTKAYFTDLYRWLEHEDGYANVSEFLHTYEIPAEFGIQFLKGRAPKTSSTDEAISLSLGRVEQEVMEMIQQQADGFRGGWVSSIALDDLLREKRMEASMSRHKRLAMMRSLGYIHHPALHKGRATTIINNSRPVLFIKIGHLACNITDQTSACQAYINAQSVTVAGFGSSAPASAAG